MSHQRCKSHILECRYNVLLQNLATVLLASAEVSDSSISFNTSDSMPQMNTDFYTGWVSCLRISLSNVSVVVLSEQLDTDDLILWESKIFFDPINTTLSTMANFNLKNIMSISTVLVKVMQITYLKLFIYFYKVLEPATFFFNQWQVEITSLKPNANVCGGCWSWIILSIVPLNVYCDSINMKHKEIENNCTFSHVFIGRMQNDDNFYVI